MEEEDLSVFIEELLREEMIALIKNYGQYIDIHTPQGENFEININKKTKEKKKK